MMSSATSIKRATNASVRLKPDTAGTGQVRPKPDATGTGQETDAGFRPWHFFVLASLMASTAAVVMARQSSPEHLILISLTIGAAGAAAAGLFRMLAPLAVADIAFLRQPLSERSRAALEREKALVLRSIKELEFDRAMGKLSPKDFDEMAGRLRARALLVMKQVDDHSAYRELIEKELTARLVSRARQAPAPAPALDPPPMDAAPVAQALEEIPPVIDSACASCGTPHDDDATFCKRCGARLQGAHA
jgi:zinc ribbon protein